MDYRIMEIETSSKLVQKGYDTDTEFRHILKDVDIPAWNFRDIQPSMEDALDMIESFKKDLKGRTLTIVPWIEIPWE